MDYVLIALESMVIYILIIASFRFLGKKGLSELSISDLILVVLIGESLGSIFPENVNKFAAAVICILTLVALNYFLEFLTYKSKAIRKLIEGVPVTLIKEGKIIRENLKKEMLTGDDIEEAMRLNGIDDIKKVKLAILETDGQISIISQ